MPIAINIKVDDKQVRKLINNIETGVKSFKEPLSGAADELMNDFFGKKVFDTQGAAIGSSWAALHASTLRARAKRSGHYSNPPITTSKILIWTGNLKSGFKKQVDKFKAIITNNIDYFKYTSEKRRVFGINAEVINIVIKHFEKYLKKIVHV